MKIKRGWSDGAYFYVVMPDGTRLESCYEGALLAIIKEFKEKKDDIHSI